ncbi:protoporphyrinogen/coproporphyrinogen oxidase [Microbacterium radiodurans]|uniref:NAD(P)-binding protein n=1 Tax=Microbacterium radiodurans TaxID=661398 RepID=A0A5J5IUA0_9MICO|nr:FAD-dependent oxidoreductase [Microbacterium radiodurans]KAA9089508.1 NAD(P)-binding protein [Microbacterium radiodurans]
MTDLAARAQQKHVVVVGGGIAGIVAALECARLGLRVTLLEAAGHLGGSLDRVQLGDLTVDAAAEAFPDGAPTLSALVEEVGLSGELEPARGDVTWLVGANGAAPAPADTVLGIPANPWAADVRRHIDTRGSWRAYLDRVRPPLTIGHRHSLGELVESRMGERVRDRLVAPYVLAVHGVAPEFVDVDVAASGLNAALTRTGSLSGAVSLILREPRRRMSLRGGLFRLVDALAARLHDYDVDVRVAAPVASLARAGAGWTVGVDAAIPSEPDAASPPASLPADLLVLAVDEETARSLLRGHVELPESAGPRPAPLESAMLRVTGVDLPDRGALAIGAGADPTTVRTVSRTWAGLAASLAADEHVLRVTLPSRPGDEDRVVVERARVAASALFGVEVPPQAVTASARVAYRRAAPNSLLGHAEATERIRAVIRREPGLAVVGGWLSGNSLERVAADARDEADAARHRTLWDAPAGENDPA